MGNTVDMQSIRIEHDGAEPAVTSPEAMAAQAGKVFPLAERIGNGEGEAFDFKEWYAAWRQENGLGADVPFPTHLKVEGIDTFEAVIPWKQLEDAAIQFSIAGEPLVKGGPIRLYAPSGSSACLNVKSVVVLRFLQDADNLDYAAYGFKNTFSTQELLKKP
ncbi:hypothetical protein [Paenibacillus spongiae]|uniref:Uncharacterized protein n=1 Tax=Paenibacillus spongiae TaxID=2909671 RepID=A0ABY5SHB7_9BACL|nr:hypothetical protein [Paenibacillus spongiae]UVI31860.1 hypothetical protein L1F29_08615 [Paenibacillus spongiae]